ncbi:MAG: hydrogenase expression/formation protein HypE [Candidatus Methanomethylicota archaeon]|jgi:hydrogenase expression/formation protein HypE|uniref:Hydrogenase expression/formation protein HypE n=1 Tax=Thermoproteota archaeon TaxID=2056631 RepID=A0A520KFE0_9CREN|nr:MAG: hydrogenase expression/formation protein HypE [Candidatus Verstraetearchaeota archaeon]TDA39464.1 MAG: hydrogenase expression/formation protein HypE [Candidatus Verstraetearchaeota archaeon]
MKIQLSHGAGGTIMNDLIKEVILKNIKNRKVGRGIGLDELDDGATIPINSEEIVVTGDAYTITPIFFPGGDIGKLAICGTINDLAVMGARPIAIMDTVVVEEGFEIENLNKIFISMNEIMEKFDISLIHGDFKVMPKGKLDGIVISTMGIGMLYKKRPILDSGLKEGDKIIVTGPIGDHGIVIISLREGISFKTNIVSDVAPLWNLMKKAMDAGEITAAKDPTRGGLAMALNEMAAKSNVSIWINEDEIPIRNEVKGACEMLGIDYLELACEGRIVMGVKAEDADNVLKAIRSTEEGKDAKIIGYVKKEMPGYVIMNTIIGGKRIINPPLGEPVPRIC